VHDRVAGNTSTCWMHKSLFPAYRAAVSKYQVHICYVCQKGVLVDEIGDIQAYQDDVNAMDTRGETPLYITAKANNLKHLKHILYNLHADPDTLSGPTDTELVYTPCGMSAIHCAAKLGHVLFRSGADPYLHNNALAYNVLHEVNAPPSVLAMTISANKVSLANEMMKTSMMTDMTEMSTIAEDPKMDYIFLIAFRYRMSAVVEAWLTGLIQHNYSQEYITILCNTADSCDKTAIYYAVGSCEWNVVHRLLHFGARANSSGSFQDPVEDDFIVAIARANKVDLLRLVMQQIVTPAKNRHCVKSSRSGIWIAVWNMAKLAIPITPIYTGLPHCRFLLPCAWLLDACAEDGETAPINRTHLSFRALTAYISMNTGAKARSRFCVKPDQQERVLLQLEERLFCANEVDAALQRRCTDHAPCLPEESVMQAVIFSPPPVVCPFNQKARGTSYDFCYHAKTCGECGGMAGEEQKLLACSVCKTAHYCDW